MFGYFYLLMFIGGVISDMFCNKKNIIKKSFLKDSNRYISTKKSNSLVRSISLRNTVVDQREDGFINISALFAASASKEKTLRNWRRKESTDELLAALSKKLDRPVKSILKIKRGRGISYAHPYIALDIAGYISPEFKVLMYHFVYDNKDEFMEKIADLSNINETLTMEISKKEKELIKIKKRGAWHQFSKTYCIYLIQIQRNPLLLKPGASTNINATLRQYRRLSATVEVKNLLYLNTTKDMKDFDIFQQRVFEPYLIIPAHEQVMNIEVKEALDKLNQIIKFANFENKITKETPEELEKYNKTAQLIWDIIEERDSDNE